MSDRSFEDAFDTALGRSAREFGHTLIELRGAGGKAGEGEGLEVLESLNVLIDTGSVAGTMDLVVALAVEAHPGNTEGQMARLAIYSTILGHAYSEHLRVDD